MILQGVIQVDSVDITFSSFLRSKNMLHKRRLGVVELKLVTFGGSLLRLGEGIGLIVGAIAIVRWGLQEQYLPNADATSGTAMGSGHLIGLSLTALGMLLLMPALFAALQGVLWTTAVLSAAGSPLIFVCRQNMGSRKMIAIPFDDLDWDGLNELLRKPENSKTGQL